MRKIAVLGANGQVGAEICLILAALPDVQVVPIARNRLGSAYLRYRGLACRHGRPADRSEAAGLLGDCDLVLNFALAMGSGRPRQARELNQSIIRNSIDCSTDGATIIYFSTMMVHGDPRPGRRIRWRSSYGHEKLAGERDARRFGRRARKACYALRLGHVCGALQNISRQIAERAAEGPIGFAGLENPSNTVHTTTIVDAVLKIADGAERPGVYDLMNWPLWSWREVYAYEARRVGDTATFTPTNAEPISTNRSRRILRRLISVAAGTRSRVELARRLIARLSPRWNRRVQAIYYQRRASQEIGLLSRVEQPPEGIDWIPLDRRPLSSLDKTAELIASGRYLVPAFEGAAPLPDDLPLAR